MVGRGRVPEVAEPVQPKGETGPVAVARRPGASLPRSPGISRDVVYNNRQRVSSPLRKLAREIAETS